MKKIFYSVFQLVIDRPCRIGLGTAPANWFNPLLIKRIDLSLSIFATGKAYDV
jgi:hypothetical protein